MAAPIKFGVGQSVLRKEDDALIRGKGRYTDDHRAAAGDARADAALAACACEIHHQRQPRPAGCRASALILTAADVGDLGDLPCLFNLEVDPFTGPPYPILREG